jgi:hypothetical protein
MTIRKGGVEPMYLELRKPYRKPVSHSNEIDLLLHFPIGSLIGGELLPHAEHPAVARKENVKAKTMRKMRDIKYHW